MATITQATTVTVPPGQKITVSGNGTIDIVKGFGSFDGSSVYINNFERSYGPIGTLDGVVKITPKTSVEYTVAAPVGASVSADSGNALASGSDGLPFLDRSSVSGDGITRPLTQIATAVAAAYYFRMPDYLIGNIPVRIWRDAERWQCSFDLEQWRTPATTTIYVSQARGNDTTGTGTMSAPYAGVKKALQSVTAGTPTNIIVESGFYNRQVSPNGTGADADINVFGVGDVILSASYEALSWTAHTVAGVYKSTRSSVSSVRDWTQIDTYGEHKRLTQVATLAECEAGLGTWYTDNTTLYVHRDDGAIPTNGARASSTQVYMESDGGYFPIIAAGTKRRQLWSNITFEGGCNGAFRVAGGMASTLCELILDNCMFRYSFTKLIGPVGTSMNGLSELGLTLCIAHNCVAYANQNDGFNHHVGPTNALSGYFLEINCLSYRNGVLGGVDNCNGYTTHEACSGLRVNCTAHGNVGPEFADIGTSKTVNVGCISGGSRAVTVPVQNAGFQSLDTNVQTNIDCVSLGSTYGAYAQATASIKTQRFATDGQVYGPVTAL